MLEVLHCFAVLGTLSVYAVTQLRISSARDPGERIIHFDDAKFTLQYVPEVGFTTPRYDVPTHSDT